MSHRSAAAIASIVIGAVIAMGSAAPALAADAGHITGTVTLQGSAKAGVNVFAEVLDQDTQDYYDVASATTSATGAYDLGGLPYDTYTIYFQDSSTDTADEVWNDRNPYLDPTGVVLSAGAPSASGINADLVRAGSISGTVKAVGLTGSDWADAYVSIDVKDPATQAWVEADDTFDVDQSGHYSITGLFPGTYRVVAFFDGDQASGTGTSTSVDVTAGGSATVDVPLSIPRRSLGSVDAAIAGPSSISVRGWAIDPDTTNAISVEYQVDGGSSTAVANERRDDVGGAFPAYGAAHGFSATFTGITPGQHGICVYSVSADGSRRLLGCPEVTVLGGPVIARIDSVRAIPGALIITGWAIDPQQNAPVTVQLVGDGSSGGWSSSATPDTVRPDVNAAYPGYSGKHGFTLVSRGPVEGYHSYSITASASGVSNSTAVVRSPLGIDIPPANPFGSLDRLQQSGPGRVSLSGWAIDTDATSVLGLHVYVDGKFATGATTTESRPDVDAAYAPFAGAHGYSTSLALTAGTHSVCTYGINQGAGANSILGCRSVTVAGGSPIGSIDQITAAGPGRAYVSGWALDPDTANPVGVHFYVDGVFQSGITANDSRPDVGAAYPGWGAGHGFSPYLLGLSGGTHTVCVYAINAGDTAGLNPQLGCRSVTLPTGSPVGNVDKVTSTSARSLTVGGWTIDPDTASSIAVHLYMDGSFLAGGVADGSRPDVGAAYSGYGDKHGFSISATGVAPGSHQVCAYALNTGGGANTGLGCSRVTVSAN